MPIRSVPPGSEDTHQFAPVQSLELCCPEQRFVRESLRDAKSWDAGVASFRLQGSAMGYLGSAGESSSTLYFSHFAAISS